MRRLLLIGGSHAHVYVLDALARSPYPYCEVTLNQWGMGMALEVPD